MDLILCRICVDLCSSVENSSHQTCLLRFRWRPRRCVTFGDLEQRSNRAAHALAARGFERGDRLGFYLSNRPEFLDLFVACVKLGVIVVPINVLYREREISHIVSDAEPKAIIASPEL